MRRFVLILLLLMVGVANAQSDEVHPVLLVNGGALAYWMPETGALDIVLADAAVQNATLNPQATYAVLELQPAMVTEALARQGGIGGGKLPSDLFLWDVNARHIVALAVQPEYASFFTENVPDNAAVYGTPAWSPDGSQVAYARYAYPDGGMTLWVFDVASMQARQLPTRIPAQMGVPVPLEVTWGRDGIVFESVEALEGPLLLYVVDPAGGDVLNTVALTGDLMGHYGYAWVTDGDRQPLGFLMQDGSWRLLDVLSGEITQPTTRPEMVSALAGADSPLRVVLKSRDGDGFNASVHGPDFTRLWDFFVGSFPLDRVELSPDGRKVLNRSTRTIDDALTGEPFDLPMEPIYPSLVTWAPSLWLLPEHDLDVLTLGSAPREVCPGAMPTRLSGASYAENPTTTANNIRVGPRLSSELAGSLAAGETAQIANGPHCADGLVWWYVVGDKVGWMAEGADGEYFLAPVE